MTDTDPRAQALAAIAATQERIGAASSAERALARLDADARPVWEDLLSSEDAREAAGITSAAHLARALSHVSGVKVHPDAVRKWRPPTL